METEEEVEEEDEVREEGGSGIERNGRKGGG